MGSEILIISAVFPPEPVVSANLSYDIAAELSKTDKVTVLAPQPTRPYGFQFRETIANYPFEYKKLKSFTCAKSSFIGRMRESYSFGKACRNFIVENHKNIKLIYANTWPLFAQLLTVRAANKYRIPVIIHVQDVYPESLVGKIPVIGNLVSAVLKPIDKYILQHSDVVLAISDKMKNYLCRTRQLNEERVRVIINWQDESKFISALSDRPTNKFTFMYLGNIGPVAGVDLLIDSFVMAGLNDARLVIAGSGSMKEDLKRKAAEHKDHEIVFIDVPDGKVPETQAMADVLLLPMKKGVGVNSIPSKLPAYMFSKKPIITSVDSQSDIAECIRKAGCGFVLEPDNVVALSDCMLKVSKMQIDKLQLLGENGYRYGIQHFSKSKNLSTITTLIKSLVNNGH